MNDYLKTYEIKIRTMSPLFIGSGITIGKKEYVFDKYENRILLLNQKKLFMGLRQKRLLKKYEEYMLRGYQDLFFFFKENNVTKRDYLAWVNNIEEVADYELINKKTKEIQTFMKDAYGMPYIPGSSIKGALRTILLSEELLANKKVSDDFGIRISKARLDKRTRYLKNEDKDIDKVIFHRKNYEKPIEDEVNDVMAGLMISDSKPIKKESLCICQKVDVTVSGVCKKLPILRECLKPGTEIAFSVTINSRVFPWTMEQIKEAMQVFYENYCVEFINHFKGAPQVYSGNPILYLGGGVGFASKTCIYSVLHGKVAIRQASKIINQTISPKDLERHGHDKDVELGASPHMLKCTIYKDDLMQMGACEIL